MLRTFEEHRDRFPQNRVVGAQCGKADGKPGGPDQLEGKQEGEEEMEPAIFTGLYDQLGMGHEEKEGISWTARFLDWANASQRQ